MISQQYRSFILTVGCIAIGITYCADDGHFKVFDSHARDIYGKSHPQGSCVLLDISSIHNLVQYFQSLYGGTDVYELKGLKIRIYQYDMAIDTNVKDALNTSDQHICFKKHCFAIALYSICYSIISPCSYWNSNTLGAIIQNGSQLNKTMGSEHHLTSLKIPETVTIFGTNINVTLKEVYQGQLSDLTESRISLETLILRNQSGKTGFLMWISSHCIACIYQQNTKVKQLFSLVTYEDRDAPVMKHIKHISGVNKLVEAIKNSIQNEQQQESIYYDIQFICCFCDITENERKSIMRKHRKKHMYDSMEPVEKKRFVEEIKKKKRIQK